MIDHVCIGVSDIEKAKAFYTQALAPLGYRLMMEFPASVRGCNVAGFGSSHKPDFWISDGVAPAKKLHLAFGAPSREKVDEFHRIALEAGATDNGPPGPRPQYHAKYYGAFVLDPDGHNIEAVIHG